MEDCDLRGLIDAMGGYGNVCTWLMRNKKKPVTRALKPNTLVMWVQRDEIPPQWVPPMVRLAYRKKIHEHEEWKLWRKKYLTTL